MPVVYGCCCQLPMGLSADPSGCKSLNDTQVVQDCCAAQRQSLPTAHLVLSDVRGLPSDKCVGPYTKSVQRSLCCATVIPGCQ